MRISDWSSDVCSSDLTDKVDSEVPSPTSGTLTEIKVAEGETVDVGAVLAVIGDGGAAPAEAPAEEPAAAPAPAAEATAPRSAEHTSELQSLMRLSYAVLCLKKKSN